MKEIEQLIHILNDHAPPCFELPFDDRANVRALITGASGIIGLSIFSFLLSTKAYKEGQLSIDCTCKEPNFFHQVYFSGNRITLIKANLPERNYKNFSDQYDLIMNCAGYGQPGKFLDDFENIYSINTLVVSDLLKKLKYDGYFLNIGTSEVYSEASYELSKESSLISINPNNIRNNYILAKLAAESILNKYSSDNPCARTLSARVALAYGPGAKSGDTRVMYQFFKQAALNNKIQLLDDGSAVRTYIFVSDCVKLFLSALFDRKTSPRVMNVAGNKQVTIFELAEKIANLYHAVVFKVPISKGLKDAPLEVKLDTKISELYQNGSLISIDDGLFFVKKWIDSELKYENIR
jgi:UDP-glucuronate decarboxylase